MNMSKVMADLDSLIQGRRSTRSYLQDPVSKEQIQEVLKAGIWAPSAWNGQPWRFVVLEDSEKIASLSKVILEIKLQKQIGKLREVSDPIFYSAPVVVLICAEKPLNEYSAVDTAFCAQNCFLKAEELNLSTCAIGPVKLIAEYPERKSEFSIPENWEVTLGFTLGYKQKESKAPQRQELQVIFAN
jgi:nitroreductase